jgi:hypothetical protein
LVSAVEPAKDTRLSVGLPTAANRVEMSLVLSFMAAVSLAVSSFSVPSAWKPMPMSESMVKPPPAVVRAVLNWLRSWDCTERTVESPVSVEARLFAASYFDRSSMVFFRSL